MPWRLARCCTLTPHTAPGAHPILIMRTEEAKGIAGDKRVLQWPVGCRSDSRGEVGRRAEAPRAAVQESLVNHSLEGNPLVGGRRCELPVRPSVAPGHRTGGTEKWRTRTKPSGQLGRAESDWRIPGRTEGSPWRQNQNPRHAIPRASDHSSCEVDQARACDRVRGQSSPQGRNRFAL